LAFFLWSAPPDEELLALATQNKLKDPKVLDQQTRRLLSDPRSGELVKNFAGQWLQLRNLPSAAPVTQMFPDFDDNLRQAFKSETELFFESIVREDRSLMDLLNGDYTFVMKDSPSTTVSPMCTAAGSAKYRWGRASKLAAVYWGREAFCWLHRSRSHLAGAAWQVGAVERAGNRPAGTAA